jgi:hypothetical protein
MVIPPNVVRNDDRSFAAQSLKKLDCVSGGATVAHHFTDSWPEPALGATTAKPVHVARI